MNANRMTAIVVGVLFIIGTVAGVVSVTLTGTILASPDYLRQIAANESQVLLGAFFVFVMALACPGIALALYPVLKRHNEGLAIGAVGFRIIEGVFQMLVVISMMLLLALSREFVKAGVADSSYLQSTGGLIMAGQDWINNVGMLVSWCIGALMYYWIFYKADLVPRWLSVWGLIGCTLTIASSLSVMFGVIPPNGMAQSVSNLPIALQEMVLALWLIVKGFNPAAIPAGASKTEINPGLLGASKL